MSDWDAAQYQQFRADRLRPGLDLLDRVARLVTRRPEVVVDLGCGTGTLTGHLAARFPSTRLLAVDRSPAMLARAVREADDGTEFVDADLRSWSPPAPVDLVFSNAVLHWLPDRSPVLAAVAGWLSPDGVLGLQMPRNFEEPTHQVAYALGQDERFREALAPVLADRATAESPEELHAVLEPLLVDVEVWETTYLHVLSPPDPVVRWAQGSLLRPFLSALPDEASREAFLGAYRERIAAAYPARPDGTTLLPYRRVFAVGRRG